jgi:hypothetical protein
MHWEKNINNPIVDGDIVFGQGYRTEDSKVTKRGDFYYMFNCSGKDGDHMDIYVLKSPALEGPWEKVQEEPIISRGNFYDFDFRYLRLGGITFDNGNWYLYYSGQNILKPKREDAIGIAITSDKNFPFGWKKYNKNPVLKKSGNNWESNSILTLSVKKIGQEGKEWYGHYTGRGKDGKYHLGACYSNSPLGPFIRANNNPILGQGDWDFNGPARADIIKFENKIYGAYESAKTGPVFQIGGYRGDSTEGPFEKIFQDKPFLSGLEEGSQFANPCFWQENGKLYLFVGRKVVSNQTPYWRYIDLFTLIP